MDLARVARTPIVAAVLVVTASFVFATIPALNYFAGGWERPLLLTGMMRLAFSLGMLVLLYLLYRSLLSRHGLRVTVRVMREEWKLLGLAMLTTGDVALFSLSYRFVDISVTTALTSLAPAANVVLLVLLNKDRLTRRQGVGLSASAMGMVLVMWAGGASIEVGGEWWRTGVGLALGMSMVACSGLVVAALRLGEVLAIEWYWEGLGDGAGLVWCGSMLTLALAQGVTAPLFILLAMILGAGISVVSLGLMMLMGFVVLAGTALWALANGSGLRPVVNGLGDIQPGWAVLILAVSGITGDVAWLILLAGLTVIVASNFSMQWAARSAFSPPGPA